MKRGLKFLWQLAQPYVATGCEGTFPDEEGTEMRPKNGVRAAQVRAVKEPSPMKRGLKLGTVSAVQTVTVVKEPSPMKRGLKFSEILHVLQVLSGSEGTFPDEEGTEMLTSRRPPSPRSR